MQSYPYKFNIRLPPKNQSLARRIYFLPILLGRLTDRYSNYLSSVRMYDWSRTRFRTLSMTLFREVRIKCFLDLLITAWSDSIVRITILKVLQITLRNKTLLRCDQLFSFYSTIDIFHWIWKGGQRKRLISSNSLN